MNPTLRLIFSAIGIALSIAVLVLMVITKDPDLKTMVLLLALGMASQSIAIFDQLGNKDQDNEVE